MADESTKVDNAVKYVFDSKERVAFDLMVQIGKTDPDPNSKMNKDKEYWFKLYRECFEFLQKCQ